MQVTHIPLERAIGMLAMIKDFKNLSASDLSAIAQVCHWHRYDAGEAIVRYQDESDSVFFIIHGKVRINYNALSGKEVILGDLSLGEIFGELTAIDGKHRSASVIAQDNTLLASVSATDFLNQIYSNQQVAAAILLRLAGQIRELTRRVIESDTLKVPTRICSKLVHLAESQKTVGDNQASITTELTHAEIACLIGTNREAVTKQLNILEDQHVIMRERDTIRILDWPKLLQMAGSAPSHANHLQ